MGFQSHRLRQTGKPTLELSHLSYLVVTLFVNLFIGAVPRNESTYLNYLTWKPGNAKMKRTSASSDGHQAPPTRGRDPSTSDKPSFRPSNVLSGLTDRKLNTYFISGQTSTKVSSTTTSRTTAASHILCVVCL